MLEGSVLGLNALGLVVIAYITLSLHQRLRMFSRCSKRADFCDGRYQSDAERRPLILTDRRSPRAFCFNGCTDQ